MSTEARSHRPPPAAILLIPVAVALVLTLFAWPTARLEPRDLPVGVAGPPAAADAIERRLAAGEGAFEVHRYAGEAAARQAIEDRDVYGAFVASPAGAKVLIASAASPAVAQALTTAASEGGAPGRPAAVPVEDVVAAPTSAQGLPSSVLPLVIAGLLTAVAATTLASGALPRAGLLLAGSVLAGLTATAIVQSWLDIVGGEWATNAAVLSLTVLAIASVVAGLRALFGAPGAILGAVTMVLIGNPFSGVGAAPELLPPPAGDIGQLMPPGAGGNLLRSTGFFDGAGAGGHVAVLVAWSVAGLAALLASAARSRLPGSRQRPVPA
jgi:hypothetical protein